MIKKGKNTGSGFTLIEVLVVIAVTAVLAIGVANINWNRLTDKQKVTIFKNRVISDVETIRNNALFGKWVTVNSELIVPFSWRVDISNANIAVLYQETPTDIFTLHKTTTINEPEIITTIYCWDSISPVVINPAQILFEWSELSFGSSTCPNDNIVSLDLSYKQFSESIEINRVSGLIGDK